MEFIASILVRTRLSAGTVVTPANENMDGSTSQVWTGQLQNRIIPISSCPVKAPLWTQYWARQWQLDWRWLTYLRNIILQGYYQMYSIPPSTSPISGTSRFWTRTHCWLWGLSNLQQDKLGRLVVWYTGSTSCQSDNCGSHMCIRH